MWQVNSCWRLIDSIGGAESGETGRLWWLPGEIL